MNPTRDERMIPGYGSHTYNCCSCAPLERGALLPAGVTRAVFDASAVATPRKRHAETGRESYSRSRRLTQPGALPHGLVPGDRLRRASILKGRNCLRMRFVVLPSVHHRWTGACSAAARLVGRSALATCPVPAWRLRGAGATLVTSRLRSRRPRLEARHVPARRPNQPSLSGSSRDNGAQGSINADVGRRIPQVAKKRLLSFQSDDSSARPWFQNRQRSCQTRSAWRSWSRRTSRSR